jgi:hypothetical protein
MSDIIYAAWDFCKSKNTDTGGSMDETRFKAADEKFLPMLNGIMPWQKARGVEFSPNRGICDYGWTADFGRRLTREELVEVCGWLHSHKNCPGWTGVHGREHDTDKGFVYHFTTTMDSSD